MRIASGLLGIAAIITTLWFGYQLFHKEQLPNAQMTELKADESSKVITDYTTVTTNGTDHVNECLSKENAQTVQIMFHSGMVVCYVQVPDYDKQIRALTKRIEELESNLKELRDNPFQVLQVPMHHEGSKRGVCFSEKDKMWHEVDHRSQCPDDAAYSGALEPWPETIEPSR